MTTSPTLIMAYVDEGFMTTWPMLRGTVAPAARPPQARNAN